MILARRPLGRQLLHGDFIACHDTPNLAKHPLLLNRQLPPPVRAARTLRIPPQLELPELQRRPVNVQQPPDQRLADPREQFDRLQRLQCSDQTRHHPQHPRLGARRHRARLRRARIHAAVTRTAQMRREDRHLTLETPDRSVDIRNPQRHARVIRRIPRRKIVAPVDHHVPPARQLHGIRRRETLADRLDPHVRIDPAEPRLRRFDLRAPHLRRAMQNLPVQIGKLHRIRIDNPQRPHPRRRQIQRRWRPQPPAPISNTRAARNFSWPAIPNSGTATCRAYRRNSSCENIPSLVATARDRRNLPTNSSCGAEPKKRWIAPSRRDFLRGKSR